ncbi:leucine-rich repeat-containing protein 27-like [Xyrichtys novacula]|uniref:Leucine-rich repeat protein SHOC-2 n=1 Tax=Xyrichtys novacula TaxID=13765 RepID=A0AAV1G123_XYRNO|nr:leucine-rich repeat-containing protein 27-like [Xyrichtys novacula]
MTSPKGEREDEEIPDLQPNFVFGNTFIKPKTKSKDTQREDSGPLDLPEYYSTDMLCLRRTNLKHVTDSILKSSSVKCLYLEGNQITSIPESFFISLPNLLWLDLRNNQIETLPAEIGLHRCLKTLLLEGNPISELPEELGNVPTLEGLNLRNCPITYPPQEIINQGVHSILQYLRTALAKRPVSVMKTSPELPVMEKLQLSELRGSSVEEQEETVDEDELQRFRELKNKMIQLDKAELGSIAQRDKKSHPLPVVKRKKETSKAGIIPELRLFDTQQWKRPEERRQAAMKEKQAVLEQRRKSQEALRAWRSQPKPKKQEKWWNQEEADTNLKADVEDSLHTQTPSMTITEQEESRSARKLERQIRSHVETMQERRKNPRGTSKEQMAAAEQDLEEMRKLQTRLLEKRERNLGKCFTIFTGDNWPSYLDN